MNFSLRTLEHYSAIASMSVITGNVQCRGASNTAGAISGNADFWGTAFNDYALIGGNLTYHATGTVNFGQQNAIGNYPPIGGGDESIGGDIIITAVSRPALQPI